MLSIQDLLALFRIRNVKEQYVFYETNETKCGYLHRLVSTNLQRLKFFHREATRKWESQYIKTPCFQEQSISKFILTHLIREYTKQNKIIHDIFIANNLRNCILFIFNIQSNN